MQKPDLNRLKEVVFLFLRLGFTAFGGPAAHVSIFHDEVVKRRKWMDEQSFLDLISASQLIPGPNSTEVVLHISYLRAGWLGLVLGGFSFILPAMGMVLALAWGYVRFGSTPQVGAVLQAIMPVVLAIILKALWSMGKKALGDIFTLITGVGVMVLNILGVNNILLLVAAGLILMVIRNIKDLRIPKDLSHLIFPGALLGRFSNSISSFNYRTLFFTFLKIGSVLYGGGYLLLAYLRADFVQRLGWLTDQQLIDAIAVGQVTPGPLFTTATFIGFNLGGFSGALVATIGIFLPSMILVAISNPYIPRLRESKFLSGFLDGVNAASIGLMAAVTIDLSSYALADGYTLILAAASLLLFGFTKISTTWMVLIAALLGLFRNLVGF